MTAALDLAHTALERVHDEPTASRDTALALLGDDEVEVPVRVVARWALGRAHHELDNVSLAVETLEEALVEADGAGMDREAGEIRVSLAVCLFNEGRVDQAFERLDQAEAHLDGAAHARAVMQRALLEHRRGAQHVALELFDQAGPVLRDAGDAVGEARLLANRSALHTYLGHWSEAEADLDRLVVLADGLQQRMMQAVAYQNLAFLLGRKGELPRALEVFALSRRAMEEIDNPPRLVASLDVDEADLMMAAGLFHEAAQVARGAVDRNVASGNSIGEGDARLLLSQALLQSGWAADASAEADRAAITLLGDGRDAWAALARFVALRAQLAQLDAEGRGLEPAAATEALELVRLLESQGWLTEALHVRADVAQALVETGRAELAAALLDDAPDLRSSGSFLAQLTAWRVEALGRLVGDAPRSAARALVAGLRLLETHRAQLGATEMRAHASAHGTAIASLGLGLAVRRGRPRGVLLWSERLRATALVAHPAAAPVDGDLSRSLADLRQAQVTARQEISGGVDPASAERRVRQAEANVTRASRRLGGHGRATDHLTASRLDRLIDALGPRTLVEFARVGSDVVSITVIGGVARLRHVGPTAKVDALVDRLLFAVRRLVGRRARPGEAQAAAVDLVEHTARALEALLVGPAATDAAELVVVPTGRLHDVPWGFLPGLRGVPTTVSPSLRMWSGPSNARRDDGAQRRVGLVAGPDLPGAPVEAAELATVHDGVRLLGGAQATPPAVLAMFEEMDLVHVSAHGTFRDESPMFSEIHLHDGSLTVHDIERLVRVPDTVVLPACDAGRHQAAVADEVLGTVGTMLSLGVRSVVAPVMAIGDEPTVGHMVALHNRLAAGVEPSSALALVRQDSEDLDPVARATAFSFCSFGAGSGWTT